MTQLSPLSLKVLDLIKRVLHSLQRFFSSGNTLIFKTIPQILNNIRYALIALKDIATFVPSHVYKLIAIVIAISFLRRIIRKSKKNKQQAKIIKQEKVINLRQHEMRQIQKELDKLGPEFQVRQNQGPTRPGETQDQQDSCCEDLTHHLSKSNDFRDIVFFELMRGYSRSASQKEREDEYEAQS